MNQRQFIFYRHKRLTSDFENEGLWTVPFLVEDHTHQLSRHALGRVEDSSTMLVVIACKLIILWVFQLLQLAVFYSVPNHFCKHKIETVNCITVSDILFFNTLVFNSFLQNPSKGYFPFFSKSCNFKKSYFPLFWTTLSYSTIDWIDFQRKSVLFKEYNLLPDECVCH